MRVTKKNLEDRIDNINIKLTEIKLSLEGRYGYFAIDLKNKYTGSCIETLKTGCTKKEIGIFLKGFSEALFLAKADKFRRENK